MSRHSCLIADGSLSCTESIPIFCQQIMTTEEHYASCSDWALPLWVNEKGPFRARERLAWQRGFKWVLFRVEFSNMDTTHVCVNSPSLLMQVLLVSLDWTEAKQVVTIKSGIFVVYPFPVYVMQLCQHSTNCNLCWGYVCHKTAQDRKTYLQLLTSP